MTSLIRKIFVATVVLIGCSTTNLSFPLLTCTNQTTKSLREKQIDHYFQDGYISGKSKTFCKNCVENQNAPKFRYCGSSRSSNVVLYSSAKAHFNIGPVRI